MSPLRILSFSMICLAWMASTASATLYSWAPSDNDLADFPHEKYSTWGISLTNAQAINLYQELSSGEFTITGATMTFVNIYDWTVENNDHLYTHLLTDPRAGFTQRYDTTYGDQFAGQGELIGNWSDPLGGHPRGFNLVYDFAELDLINALQDYILTNNSRSFFGFGFDADCHYYNCGVTFTINTETIPDVPTPDDPVVPEPATMALLGIGLSGLGFIRRRRIHV